MGFMFSVTRFVLSVKLLDKKHIMPAASSVKSHGQLLYTMLEV